MDGRVRTSLLSGGHNNPRPHHFEQGQLYPSKIPWYSIGMGYSGSPTLLQHFCQESSSPLRDHGWHAPHRPLCRLYCRLSSLVPKELGGLCFRDDHHWAKWLAKLRRRMVRWIAVWRFSSGW